MAMGRSWHMCEKVTECPAADPSQALRGVPFATLWRGDIKDHKMPPFQNR